MQTSSPPPTSGQTDKGWNMRTHALIAFLLALVAYLFCYTLDRHLRLHRGPWLVQFIQDETNHAPAMIIDQNRLGVHGLKLVFLEERPSPTFRPGRVAFDSPLKVPAFGRLKFHDLTFLPGTVTFDVFGHEVELLPRVLFIDKKEIPWGSASTIQIAPTNANSSRPGSPRLIIQ